CGRPRAWSALPAARPSSGRRSRARPCGSSSSCSSKRLYSTGNEKVHEGGAVRQVADDVRARQRPPLQQDGPKADAVILGAVGMLADVTDLEAHAPVIEPREPLLAVAPCRGGMGRVRADVEHELDTRCRGAGGPRARHGAGTPARPRLHEPEYEI